MNDKQTEPQVKTKKRVAEHGEVFTAEREVNDMLGLVKKGGNYMPNNYIVSLIDRLERIKEKYISIIQSINYESYLIKPNPFLSLSGRPSGRPEIRTRGVALTPKQYREKDELSNSIHLWVDDMNELLSIISPDEEIALRNTIKDIDLQITFMETISSPEKAASNIQKIQDHCLIIKGYLKELDNQIPKEYYYVVDTSAIIECPDFQAIPIIADIGRTVFIIPPTTLKELEDLKSSKRDQKFLDKVKVAIDYIYQLLNPSDPLSLINISHSKVVEFLADEPDFQKIATSLDPQINDDRILASAIELQRKKPLSVVTLIANDKIMMVKAFNAGVPYLNLLKP